jgi:serine phosphatase RsbU (regulator of sigma subunit)
VILNALFILVAALVTFLHLDRQLLTPAFTQVTVSVLLGLSWLAALRFLLSDTWGRWLWLVVLAGTFLLVVTQGSVGMGFGIALSHIFLTMRQYQSWRHISDRRRAVGFGLGLLALVLVVFCHRFWALEAPESGFLAVLRHVGGWSLWSLVGFWFWSLFHLAIHMRLHFLRLRPKLAVSAILIGFVPLVLVLVMGVMIFYTGLGGARAQRASNILEGWRQEAHRGADLSGAPFDTTFVWSAGVIPLDRNPISPLSTTLEAPWWAGQLDKALSSEIRVNRQDTLRESPIDTTGWFLVDQEIWLMQWQDAGTDRARTRGWLLGQAPLEQLSEVLTAGLDITSFGGSGEDPTSDSRGESETLRRGYPGRKISYRDVSDDPAFWGKFRFFGSSMFEVINLRGDRVSETTVFINLRVRWQDLRKEFLEGENNINVAVVVSLGVVATLFLILEIFAFMFGLRITEGFVTAVHKLDRGTKALTAGDLDTVIDIPNDDELGDLAHSFNEMTKSIRQGREDALANERLTRELETARGIQERLLPAGEPELAGFEVTGASIPSREIGGDYFDFLMQDDRHLGVAIGDVSGKGMPAALLMSNLQASLQGQVIHPSSVAEIVTRVNNLIVGSTDPHMFATFFYGLLDLTSGTFTSTNAGHNPPLVLRNDGSIELLKTGGLLLGMVSGVVYKQETITLEPGEIIVMYTDGITEAVGPSAEEDDPEAMFGEEPLIEVVRRSSHLPAVGIKEAILDAVSQHTQGVAQSDDITLVVVRRQG